MESTFTDGNTFPIGGKSFTTRYFPDTQDTFLLRTNAVTITQEEINEAIKFENAITTDGAINYGQVFPSTNEFLPIGAPEQFVTNFANSPDLQRTVIEAAKTTSGQTTTQPSPPNPDQSGGSAPLPQPPTDTQPADAMLVYPEGLESQDQDRIKFQALKYEPRALPNNTSNQFETVKPEYTTADIPVFLPIQSPIVDQNNVGWESDTLNPIELKAIQLSLAAMTNPNQQDLAKEIGTKFQQATEILKKDVTAQAVRTYLAGQAVGVNNLLSRLNGQVLNPNLELLFQGPQLRPFSFTFKMSARNSREAVKIKKIIKYFKKNMSASVAVNGLFLEAPNVFKIEYQRGRTNKHPSINLIKECALTNCSVDYTPLGSYMTYSDSESTMIAYTMTLSFQELTPVYDRDYLNGEGKEHPIGY